jgi:hypothetical protein
MCVFYKITRTDDDSVEASLEDGCVIIKSVSDESPEYDEHIVLDIIDFEAIIWNWKCLQEEKKGGK